MVVTLIIKTLFKQFEYTLAAISLKIIKLVETNLAGRTEVDKSLEKVKAALKTLNDVLVRIRKHAYTDELAAIDTTRDNYYRALVGRLESDILWDFDSVRQENAKKLLTIIEENGKTMKRGDLEQSNQLENLFGRFNEQLAIIDANGYRPLYDNIVKVQKQFDTVSGMSVAAESDKKEIPRLSEARENMIDALNNDLFKRLDILADDNGEPFVTVINILNKAIEEEHKVQRARIARGETDKPVEDSDKKAPEDKAKVKAEEPQKEQMEEETASV